MTNVNQFLIKPSFKIKVAYCGFGIFLLILSIPIAFISIIPFGPTLLVVVLFFLLICGFLVLAGIFFIAGSFRSFIGIHNDKIRFRNYFRTQETYL